MEHLEKGPGENEQGVAQGGFDVNDTSVTRTDDWASLSEALGGSEDGAAREAADDKPEAEQPQGSGTEGGISAEVRKALSEQQQAYEARLSRYEAQVAALREESLAREADALVAAGTVTDRAIALEYLRMKASKASQASQPAQDAPVAPAAPTAQPRDEQGRFAKQPEQRESAADAALKKRATMLFGQAQAIAEEGGPDMLALFESDREIHDKVSSGAWDFKDAALHLMYAGQGRRVPMPVKTPNHTQARRSFAGMSREDLEAFDRRIENGEVFDARR